MAIKVCSQQLIEMLKMYQFDRYKEVVKLDFSARLDLLSIQKML